MKPWIRREACVETSDMKATAACAFKAAPRSAGRGGRLPVLNGAAALVLTGVLTGALTAALTGCASGVRPSQPGSVAELVPSGFAVSGSGTTAGDVSAALGGAGPVSAPELPWTRFFTQPRTRALIELALQHNRDLRVAVLNVEQARALAAVRDADLWPTVNLGLSGARTPTSTGGTSQVVSGGLVVAPAYELDLFGRVRALSEAAAQQWRASGAQAEAARISLIAAVASAHAALRADAALLTLTQQTVTSREQSLAMQQRRLAVGAGSALDVAQAEALLQAARAALAQVQRQMAQDESTLVLLVGRPLPADLPPDEAWEPLQAPAGATLLGRDMPALAAEVPSTVLMRRPDVAAAEAQLRGAQANLEAARAAFFPRISLTASFGQASRDLTSLFSGGTWVWGVAPQLLQPLFDGGRNRAAAAQSRAAQAAAVAQYEKTVQVAFKEVADALAGRQTLLAQEQALRAQVTAEAERVRLSQRRLDAGAASGLELLDAQRSLLSAQSALMATQAQVAQNQALLYKVLGGGAAR